MSPVRYELGFISQKTTFFIVTAVKPSNLTSFYYLLILHSLKFSEDFRENNQPSLTPFLCCESLS
jgi:hypothetical protein